MSLYSELRELSLPDDGIKCVSCGKGATKEDALFDVTLRFCDGASIDGSMKIAVHRACMDNAFDGAVLRRRQRRIQARLQPSPPVPWGHNG